MDVPEPIILPEQQVIVEWARELKNKHVNLATIVESLTSNEEVRSPVINEKLTEMRKLYQKCNAYWRERILLAIMLNSYRLDNDFEDGDVVTNGEFVGYAYFVNYESRQFELYGGKLVFPMGRYNMNNFWKYKKES